MKSDVWSPLGLLGSRQVGDNSKTYRPVTFRPSTPSNQTTDSPVSLLTSPAVITSTPSVSAPGSPWQQAPINGRTTSSSAASAAPTEWNKSAASTSGPNPSPDSNSLSASTNDDSAGNKQNHFWKPDQTQRPPTNKTSDWNSTACRDIENSLTDEWWDSLFSKENPPADALTVDTVAANKYQSDAAESSSLGNTSAALRLSTALQRLPVNGTGDADTCTGRAVFNGVNSSGPDTKSTSKKIPPPTLPKDTRKIAENAILREWRADIAQENSSARKGPRTMQYDQLKEASLLRERPQTTQPDQDSPVAKQRPSSAASHPTVNGKTHDEELVNGNSAVIDTKNNAKPQPKPVKFEGIGPTHNGVPVATRNSVDEANRKDWYRCMYRTLHKTEKPNEDNISQSKYIMSDAETLLKDDDSAVRASSPDSQSLYPPHARYRVQRYKNQPMRIEDYEPGFHSSIAQKQAKTCESERLLENLKSSDDDNVKKSPQGHRQRGLSRSASRADSQTFRQQWDEESRRRRQEIERIIESERHKRFLEEQRNIKARKHSDYQNPLQKSSILLNRFDEDSVLSVGTLTRPMYQKPTRVRGKARAVHTFHAQDNRELSLQKGDTVYLLRQVDQNWFKGERHGNVGIFPINYVEVLKSLDEAQIAAGLKEGRACAKYNVKGQNNKELSLVKGDVVKLIRRIDDDWYEGRAGDRQGIVPVVYLEITKEPETPHTTPMSSRAATPVQGRVSPASSTMSIGPDIPSAPMSPWMSDFYDSEVESEHRRSSRSRDASRERHSAKNNSVKNTSSLRPTANYMPYRSQNMPYSSSSEPSTLSRDVVRHDDNNRPRDLFDIARSRRQDVNDPHGLTLPKDSHVSRSTNSLDNRREQHRASTLRAQSSSPSLMTSARRQQQQQQQQQAADNFVVNTQRYKVLYPYSPLHSDELELEEDDIVQVMDKCEDGWFVGTSERTNEFGTFPGNYVEPIDAR